MCETDGRECGRFANEDAPYNATIMREQMTLSRPIHLSRNQVQRFSHLTLVIWSQLPLHVGKNLKGANDIVGVKPG